jgi:hypothetical protein
MPISPQDVCEKLLNVTKDKSRLLVGLTKINEKKREDILNAIKLIEQNTIPTAKKSKHPKEDQLFGRPENIINELKKNLSVNTSNTYIRYCPTDASEINKITELDVKRDMEDIKRVHSMVANNEIKVNAFALYEAYCRGKIYFKLRSKFSDIKSFIDYCDQTFDISKSTVYVYLNVYHLHEEFPSILLSGFGVNKLYKYRDLIINYAKEDKDLYTLLTKTFPGIKSDNIEICDPIVDDEDMNLDLIDLKM